MDIRRISLWKDCNNSAKTCFVDFVLIFCTTGLYLQRSSSSQIEPQRPTEGSFTLNKPQPMKQLKELEILEE